MNVYAIERVKVRKKEYSCEREAECVCVCAYGFESVSERDSKKVNTRKKKSALVCPANEGQKARREHFIWFVSVLFWGLSTKILNFIPFNMSAYMEE